MIKEIVIIKYVVFVLLVIYEKLYWIDQFSVLLSHQEIPWFYVFTKGSFKVANNKSFTAEDTLISGSW